MCLIDNLGALIEIVNKRNSLKIMPVDVGMDAKFSAWVWTT